MNQFCIDLCKISNPRDWKEKEIQDIKNSFEKFGLVEFEDFEIKID